MSTGAENGPDIVGRRILNVAVITAIWSSSLLIVATYCYAYSQDPWLTPRFTTYMRVLWIGRDVGQPFLQVALLAGLFAIFKAPSVAWRIVCILSVAMGFALQFWAMSHIH